MSSLSQQKNSEKRLSARVRLCRASRRGCSFILPFLIVDKRPVPVLRAISTASRSRSTHYMNELRKNERRASGAGRQTSAPPPSTRYSFYLLGSPFFWLTHAVAARRRGRRMPMVPLFMLKFGVRGPRRVHVSAPLCPNAATAAVLASVPVCAVRLYGLQHVFQPFSRLHRAVPASCCGRWTRPCYENRRAVFPVLVAVNLAQQLLLFCRADRLPVPLLLHQAVVRANTACSVEAVFAVWRSSLCWAARMGCVLLCAGGELCLAGQPPHGGPVQRLRLFALRHARSSISPFSPRCSSRRTRRICPTSLPTASSSTPA